MGILTRKENCLLQRGPARSGGVCLRPHYRLPGLARRRDAVETVKTCIEEQLPFLAEINLGGVYPIYKIDPAPTNPYLRVWLEMQALRFLAWWIEFLSPRSRRLEPVQFIDTVSAATQREMDLRLEAGAAAEFREVAEKDGYLTVPQIDWSRSAKRVMTLDWIDGAALTDTKALDASVQLAARPKERVRLVSMPAEKDR